jgi:hypothetical protein
LSAEDFIEDVLNSGKDGRLTRDMNDVESLSSQVNHLHLSIQSMAILWYTTGDASAGSRRPPIIRHAADETILYAQADPPQSPVVLVSVLLATISSLLAAAAVHCFTAFR